MPDSTQIGRSGQHRTVDVSDVATALACSLQPAWSRAAAIRYSAALSRSVGFTSSVYPSSTALACVGAVTRLLLQPRRAMALARRPSAVKRIWTALLGNAALLIGIPILALAVVSTTLSHTCAGAQTSRL